MRLLGWPLAMLLMLSCANALALSAGGGKAKKHRNGKDKDGKAAKDDDEAPEKETFVKPALPAPESVIVLSTFVFDSVSDDLGLSAEQKTKIEATKKDIREKGEALSKEQADARTAYDAAKKEKDVETAMEHAVAAASACKHFSPQTEFNQALSKILTADQFAKYVELISKR